MLNFPAAGSTYPVKILTTCYNVACCAGSELKKSSNPLEYGPYHPANLFDHDSATCWCEGEKNTHGCRQKIYFSLPYAADRISILNGYHKSKQLYLKNSRLKTAQLTFFLSVNRSGRAIQTGLEYTLYPLKGKKKIFFKDEMKKQTFSIPSCLDQIKRKVKKIFKRSKTPLINSVRVIACLTITAVYPGSRYKDTCITAVNFPFNEKITINAGENIIKCGNRILTNDPGSVWQHISTSPDQRWAIFIRMPSSIEGRAETEYLLYYLPAAKVITTQKLNIKAGALYGFKQTMEKILYLNFMSLPSMKKDSLVLNPHRVLLFTDTK
ncbi:MAG TPA: hypothetical protein VKS21_05690 [Spirochaetota bacterium]|nr:hypothetical protein [Spirochaetota bacterium]